MKRFTELFHELDASNRTTSKVAALKRYFREVPAEDGAWAVFFLTGNRLTRPVRSRDFRPFPAPWPLPIVEHDGELHRVAGLSDDGTPVPRRVRDKGFSPRSECATIAHSMRSRPAARGTERERGT